MRAPQPEQAGLETHDEHDFFDSRFFLLQHLLDKSRNERDPRIHQQTESECEIINTKHNNRREEGYVGG